MNKSTKILIAVLAIFVVGLTLSVAFAEPVNAKSFSCKGSKTKSVGKDRIDVLVSKKAYSENGFSVRATCAPKNNYNSGPAHHKLDKLTVKYKVGKKTYKKTKKLGYVNDYHIKMPKKFKINKITVKYHKASSNEYKKLKANCWWT